MADNTDWGFPKGRVAKTLRSILYPDLTDHDVEAIVVCLMAHLLVESRLNDVIYAWLKQDAPSVPDEAGAKADTALGKNIARMDFARKYSLIQPFFEARSPNEAKALWELNDLRTKVFHGHEIKDAKFKEYPLSDEAAVEQVFLTAQFVSIALGKFQEAVDFPHAMAERWSKRLTELGEPLL
jgi:hypothetical protein